MTIDNVVIDKMIEAAKAENMRKKAMQAALESVDSTMKAIIANTDFSLGERSLRALLAYPYIHFEEWDGDTNRQYQRGEVIRYGEIKLLIQNNGNINNPDPVQAGITKVVRTTASHNDDGTAREWIREEFCIKGMERLYNGIWYRVKASVVDSATPPSNDTGSWEVKAS